MPKDDNRKHINKILILSHTIHQKEGIRLNHLGELRYDERECYLILQTSLLSYDFGYVP